MTLLLLYHLVSFFQSPPDIPIPPQVLRFLTTTLSQWKWTQTLMESSHSSILPKAGTPTSALAPTPSIPLEVEVVTVPYSLTFFTLFIVLFIMFATVFGRLSCNRKLRHTGPPLGMANLSLELVTTHSLSLSPGVRPFSKQFQFDPKLDYDQVNVSSTTSMRSVSWRIKVLRTFPVSAKWVCRTLRTSVIEHLLACRTKLVQSTAPTIKVRVNHQYTASVKGVFQPRPGFPTATPSLIELSGVWRPATCDSISWTHARLANRG
ncbi:hypothetical protein C0992_004763 [Termitomyces sp. T32_za158]|nr:hypothetical protein C0992_004763 [Termitomyces sp. T32_za158]